ncbi:MAG: hypothetical protein IKU52_04840 [Clostridia bacterium]|nr:hypothetical protein [Clostridia bacterium]
MPCAMMHLMCAKEFDYDAHIGFYIGNIAPDCIDIREFKDKNHLRIYNADERLKKLRELADSLRLDDPYQFGVLLHLYTDMSWDLGPMAEHKSNYKGDDWFSDYRQEIRYISKFMYKHISWAEKLWEDMKNADTDIYSSVLYYPVENIKGYIEHNVTVHKLPHAIESAAFPNSLVFEFCKKTVDEFKKWLNEEDLI